MIDHNIKNYLFLSSSDIKEAMGEYNDKYKKNKKEDVNEFITNYLNILHEEIEDKSNHIIFNQYDDFDKEYFEIFNNKFYLKKGKSFVLD